MYLGKDLMDEAEHALSSYPFPQADRQSITGQGECFGATALKEEAKSLEPKQARLVKALNQALNEALSKSDHAFTWNSIQVNKDSVAARHADSGTCGFTAICLFGNFEGGAFTLADGTTLTATGQVLIFPAGQEHHSEKFQGQRYSVVYFSREGDTGTEDEAFYLTSLGFRLTKPPPGQRTVRVLYAFSGMHRRSNLGTALAKVSHKHGALIFFDLLEVDILNGEEGDLTDEERRAGFLESTAEGVFGMVVATPPCNSFSRATYSNIGGPPPLRSAQYPKGFPWLSNANKAKVQVANSLVSFTFQLLDAVAKARRRGLWVHALLEFPEHLGVAEKGHPATIWTGTEVQRVLAAKANFFTMAFFQCDFGAASAKPTRLLTTLRPLRLRGFTGKPDLDNQGRYTGPLPRNCGHSHVRTLGSDEAKFRLSRMAAYPQEMNEWIAGAILQECIGPSPSSGQGVGPRVPCTRGCVGDLPDGQRLVPGEDLYIGRGDSRKGLQPSPFANPWKIGIHGDRDQVLETFTNFAQENALVRLGARNLGGRKLWCHCKPEERCHGDILAEIYDREWKALEQGTPEEARATPEGWQPCEEARRAISRVGRGEPLSTSKRGTASHIVDGAGLCSPGKWRTSDRVDVAPLFSKAMREVLEVGVHRWSTAVGSEPRRLLFSLAVGKHTDFEAPESLVLELAAQMWALVGQDRRVGAPGPSNNKIDFDLLHHVAKALGDPDAEYPIVARDGVPLGVTPRGGENPMPRALAIYEEKQKWALPQMDWDHWAQEAAWADNYKSAKAIGSTLKDQFEDEVQRGHMVKMSVGSARQRWGEKLTIAALGAIEKSDDTFRIIFDASNKVCLNHRIRVQDQVRMPVWQDIAKYLETFSAGAGVRFCLTFDVSHAHRQIPVREEDWGYLACRAEEGSVDDITDQHEVYINTVGTFGVGSAAYWWSRLAAVIARAWLGIGADVWESYFLMYVDDGWATALGPGFAVPLLALMLFLGALRVPLSPRKTRGGTEVDWVGYRINVKESLLGVTEQRRLALIRWCREVSAGQMVVVRDLRSHLGRLIFVAGPLQHIRPFLGPAFAWIAAVPNGAAMVAPLTVRAPMKWIGLLLDKFPQKACAPRPAQDTKELFRVDAKAEGTDIAVIGGWSTAEGEDTKKAAWFSHRITPEEYPWVFEKGRPFKVIAALELLAVLYGIVLLVPSGDYGDSLARIPISAGTDNQGNDYLVRKMLTTKFPLCLVAMELASQLTARHLDLRLAWRRRDTNEEADALTNEEFGAFDPARRLEARGASRHFLCLQEMEEATREWRREKYSKAQVPRTELTKKTTH